MPQKSDHQETDCFLIVARPAEEAEVEDQWEGTINKVVHLTKKQIRTLEEEMKKSMGKQQAEIVTAIKVGATEVSGMKSEVSDIKSKVNEVNEIRAQVAAIEREVAGSQDYVEETVKKVKEMMEVLLAAVPKPEDEKKKEEEE